MTNRPPRVQTPGGLLVFAGAHVINRRFGKLNMTCKKFSALVLAACSSLALSPALAAQRVSLDHGTVDVYFAPEDNIGTHVAEFIDRCSGRVLLAGYWFTHADVARAVSRAKARRLDVRVVLDSTQQTERYSGVTFLRNADVPVWINSRHGVMHHKFVVCGVDSVGFGSANFTKAAMGGRSADPLKSNAENFNLFVGVPALAQLYAAEFEGLVAESARTLNQQENAVSKQIGK